MFRLTKKKGRRHKSADSLLLAAPVEQQRKETFSLALPDLRDKDALVDVCLNDGARYAVCLSARTTAGEVVGSVLARLPEGEVEDYQLYVQFKFGYGRMLEDHVVLSELGDDWGPVIRLALWTRDRRPFRTQSSENLLSHSTQSLLRPTSHTKDDTDLSLGQEGSPGRWRHCSAGVKSLTHLEHRGLLQGMPHTSSQWTLSPACTDSPPPRSSSVVSLSRSSAFRISPLRTQLPRTRAESADIGREKGKPPFLPAGINSGVSPRRQTMTRQGSVPNQVHNTVATDTRVIVFEDGWSHTQSMPTTPTHVANGSVFPFSQDSRMSLTSNDAHNSSTHVSDILRASGVSIDSLSSGESNLDHPFMTRAPSGDQQEDSDYFDRLEVVSSKDTASASSPGAISEDYFDRLNPTLDDYFDHLEAPVIAMSRSNWDTASFLKQRARSHTQGSPPPKPFRGPTPTHIAETIEKWNSKLRKSRVMRITASPDKQSTPGDSSSRLSTSGRSTRPLGLRSIIRRSPQEGGTEAQPKVSAPQQQDPMRSEGSTSLSNLLQRLPSSPLRRRRSSSLTNLKVCRVQQQQPPADPPCLPRPPHGRISQTSVDSSLCQHLFPDGKVQRLRKRTSDTAETLDEEHLRLTAEEVQALYAATLGPMLCKGRAGQSHTPPGPPLLPPRTDSLHSPRTGSDQIRETLLTMLMETTLNDSNASPPSVMQNGCGSPSDCPLGVAGDK